MNHSMRQTTVQFPSRRTVIWVVGGLFYLIGFFMWAAHGAWLIAALLLPPVALLSLIASGGIVTFLWFTLLFIRVALVGQVAWSWACGTVTAILVGLTPHALFLMLLNPHLGESFQTLDGVERLGLWAINYETFVLWMHEGWNAFPMVSVMLGVIPAAIVLALAIYLKKIEISNYWGYVTDRARWIGIALLAATTFTIATVAPEGLWRPDKIVLVRERVEQAADAVAKLHLYQEANQQLEQAPVLWQKALTTAALGRPEHTSGFSFTKTEPRFYEILQEVAARGSQSRLMSADALFFYKAAPIAKSNGLKPSIQASRREAESLRRVILSAETKITEERKQFQELVAGTIAGVVSDMAKVYAGELASAFIEDAAKMLALKILDRSPSVHEMINWLTSGHFSQANFADLVLEPLLTIKAAMARPAVVSAIREGLETRMENRLEAARTAREAARRVESNRSRGSRH